MGLLVTSVTLPTVVLMAGREKHTHSERADLSRAVNLERAAAGLRRIADIIIIGVCKSGEEESQRERDRKKEGIHVGEITSDCEGRQLRERLYE